MCNAQHAADSRACRCHAALPRLQAWFQWFNETQAGALSGSYQWRGRDAGTQQELNPKTLASGWQAACRLSHCMVHSEGKAACMLPAS